MAPRATPTGRAVGGGTAGPRAAGASTPEWMTSDAHADVVKRLHRIRGQVTGIEGMLGEGRDCDAVITQIAAATRALQQVGFRLVAAGARRCAADPGLAAARGHDLDTLERMFLRLR